jgi:hypothetical protein
VCIRADSELLNAELCRELWKIFANKNIAKIMSEIKKCSNLYFTFLGSGRVGEARADNSV